MSWVATLNRVFTLSREVSFLLPFTNISDVQELLWNISRHLRMDLVNVNLIYNSSCLVVPFSSITMSANRAAVFLAKIFDDKVTIHYKILTLTAMKSSKFWYILPMLHSFVVTILRWYAGVPLKSLWNRWFHAEFLHFSFNKSTFWHYSSITKFKFQQPSNR